MEVAIIIALYLIIGIGVTDMWDGFYNSSPIMGLLRVVIWPLLTVAQGVITTFGYIFTVK